MADDRFEDLAARPGAAGGEAGAGEPERAVAAQRPATPRPPRRRYAAVLGAIFALMALGVVVIAGSAPERGDRLRGPKPGRTAPAFAAPLAGGGLDGDVNICQRRSDCNRQAGAVPACDVRSERVFNSCAVRDRPLVLTFVVTGGADCEPQIDRVERMRGRVPGVRFVTVVSGVESADALRTARRRGWREPVAVDRDGALVNLYDVGVCPTTVFVARGGKVRDSKLGNLTEDELTALARRPALRP